jgi:hypothetical protein
MRASLHRRFTGPLAILAASSFLMVGCSGTADPNDPNAGGGGGAEVGTADGVVNVYGTINGDEATLLEESWADWETENDIDIKYTGDKEFEKQIGIKVQGGDTPDLAIFPQPGLLADTVASGKVQELPATSGTPPPSSRSGASRSPRRTTSSSRSRRPSRRRAARRPGAPASTRARPRAGPAPTGSRTSSCARPDPTPTTRGSPATPSSPTPTSRPRSTRSAPSCRTPRWSTPATAT